MLKNALLTIAGMAAALAQGLSQKHRKELVDVFAGKLPLLSQPEIVRGFAGVLDAFSIDLGVEERRSCSAHIVNLMKDVSTGSSH